MIYLYLVVVELVVVLVEDVDVVSLWNLLEIKDKYK